ncbi:MAG: HD domain-containing protein [Lachnospiraceae bacterium]|nr:HD domain-containing protein [Lachnospiraceae bacterium]
MISISKEALCELLPQFNLIQDPFLKNTALDIWLEACSKADWNRLEDIPFGPGYDPVRAGFLHHVTAVTQYSYVIAKAYNELEANPVNIDYCVVGALLHDVCKIVEYSAAGGRTAWGTRVSHAIYGVALCEKYGIPLEITHIVASHTSKLSMPNKSPEAIIVAKADGIAAGVVHLFEDK